MLLICLTVQVVSAEGKLRGRVGRKGRKCSEPISPQPLFFFTSVCSCHVIFAIHVTCPCTCAELELRLRLTSQFMLVTTMKYCPHREDRRTVVIWSRYSPET